jgi:anti-sigma regulatory factor (Ser/Thr protein kinase)
VSRVPHGSNTVAVSASELHIPARRSELGAARKYAGEVAEAFGLDADSCYEFVYAVNEAVTNAIRHGASDEEGMIHLSIIADADRLTFVVSDQGTFTMPVLDATEIAETAEHGRGLALMASLVDEVQLCIEPGGTTVRLSKARAPESARARAG